MAGWTCPDKELIIWDGTLQADKFIGAGSGTSDFSTMLTFNGDVVTFNGDVLTYG